MKLRITKLHFEDSWGFGIGLGIVRRTDPDVSPYYRLVALTFWKWAIYLEVK